MRDHLLTLRELLTPPEAWIKEDFARRPDGTPTIGSDPAATCFCLLGGLERIAPIGSETYHQIRDYARLILVSSTNFA